MHRRRAKRTLGEVAEFLDVSAVYVSDVERGNRRPFANPRILQIADFLETDPAPLISSAALERGVIEYDLTDAGSLEAGVVGELVSGLARGGISNDQLEKIKGILSESE